MFLGKCHFHLRTVAFMSVLVRTTKNESIICVHYGLVNELLKDYNCFKLITKFFSLAHDLNRNLSLNILSVNLSSQEKRICSTYVAHTSQRLQCMCRQIQGRLSFHEPFLLRSVSCDVPCVICLEAQPSRH